MNDKHQLCNDKLNICVIYAQACIPLVKTIFWEQKEKCQEITPSTELSCIQTCYNLTFFRETYFYFTLCTA